MGDANLGGGGNPVRRNPIGAVPARIVQPVRRAIARPVQAVQAARAARAAPTQPTQARPAQPAPVGGAPAIPAQPAPAGKAPEPSKKMYYFVGGGIAIVGIFAIVLLFMLSGNETFSLSSQDISSGKSISLSENSKVNFKLDGKEYNLDVELKTNSAAVESSDGSISSIVLTVGNSKYLDVDGDGIDDVKITLESISGGKFSVRLVEVEEEAPVVTPTPTVTVSEDEEEEPVVNLTNQTNVTTDNESDGNVTVPTCSEVGEDICSSDETCSGEWVNASNSERCCSEACEANVTITPTNNETCAAKDLFNYTDNGEWGCIYPEVITHYSPDGQDNFSCCSAEPIYLRMSSSLRNTWDSISNSGNCTDYSSNLASCSPYKCDYVNNIFTQETGERGILGMFDGECHSFGELPNNGEQYCHYNDTQLISMVAYEALYEMQCGDGNCSIVLNDTGYFIDGILTDNILQEMANINDCLISFPSNP